MKKGKILYVTCDLLKPTVKDSRLSHGYVDIKRIVNNLYELGIKGHCVWKKFETELDSWLSQECTAEIVKPYLELEPDLFRSAFCVVGWELPAGLRHALESEGILWVSFAHYFWSQRKDLLIAESSSSSLLEAIHQPLPRVQPTWTLDSHLRASSLLIVEPPHLHGSRIRNGKLHSLNDCVDQIFEFSNLGKEIFAFPNILISGSQSPVLSLLGLQPLNARPSCFTAYLASDRATEIASVDPSLIHITQSFQKPFHCWNPQQRGSAIIPLRHLKKPCFWNEIFDRTAL